MKKRVWILLAGMILAIAPIPETGWAQTQAGYSVSYIWPDSLKGQFVNIFSVLVDRNGDVWVGTSGRGLMRSTDDGKTWTQIPNNLDWWSHYTFAVTREPKTGALLTGTANGLFRSTDNGASWVQPSPPPPYTTWKYGAAISCFLIRPDSSIFAGVTRGIIKSEDGGQTWRTIFYDSTKGWLVTAMTAELKNNAVFAGTFNYNPSVLRSTDGGNSWQQTGNGVAFLNVESIASDGSGTVYAGTEGNGLFHSNDSGINWTRVGIDTTQKEAWAILALRPDLVFAGFGLTGYNSGGVLRYDGKEWTRVMPSVINGAAIGAMSLAVKNGSLLVGTYDGLYRLDGVITAVKTEKPEIPSSFHLSQNYPNPFNPSTTIQFSLPTRTNVSLTVYNALGQVVETLISSEMESGTHQIVWNAGGYPSGVYFYRLETSGFIQAKRMLLVK